MLQLYKNSFFPGFIIYYYDDDAYMCIRVKVGAFACMCPQRLEVGVTGGCELGVKLDSSARAGLLLCS